MFNSHFQLFSDSFQLFMQSAKEECDMIFMDKSLSSYEDPAAAIIRDGKAVVLSAGGKIIKPDKEMPDGARVR